MTNKPLLSICIPTYNRSEFLKDALDSILRQINENNKDKVEICISDNASEDNTEELVKEYQKKSPIPIIYHKNEKNMGADYNYLKVVEIANGEYCWLLGSDDIIEEGGIDTVLEEIEKNRDIVIFYTNVQKYDITLKKKINDTFADKLTHLKDTTANGYLEYSKKLPPTGGYISNLIFNRDHWNSAPNKNKYIGTAYAHFYIFIYLLSKNFKIKFIPSKLVGQRLENDSFVKEVGSRYNRFVLDFNTLDIFKEIFGECSKEYLIFKKELLNFFVKSLISLKLSESSLRCSPNSKTTPYPPGPGLPIQPPSV